MAKRKKAVVEEVEEPTAQTESSSSEDEVAVDANEEGDSATEQEIDQAEAEEREDAPVLTDEEEDKNLEAEHSDPEAEHQDTETPVEGQEEEPAVQAPVTMEIKVRELRAAMELLAPIVPKKPAHAVLSNILLDRGRARASNLEVAAAVELPGAEGPCLVPLRTVLEMIKYVPGHETMTLYQSDKEMHMSWPDGNASFPTGGYPNEFAPLPVVRAKSPAKLVEQTVDGDVLVPALYAMLDYCATESKRPVLTGVGMFFGDSVAIGSGDGFRIAYRTLPIAIPPNDDMATVIIPASAVQVLKHLWDKTPRTPPEADDLVGLVTSKGYLQLAFGANVFRASFGPVTMVSQLIAGTPPNLAQLIPQEPPLEINIFAPDLELALHRIQSTAKVSNGTVRLVWDEGTMRVSVEGRDNGQVEVKIPVNASGEPGKVAFNLLYLSEYVRGKTGLITMCAKDPSSPVLFRYAQSPQVVIAPIQVKW